MRIELDIPRGDKQRLFLDYFNSALRSGASSYRGVNRYHEDGAFEGSVTGEFAVDDTEFVLTWTVRWLPDGTVDSVEVTADASEGQSQWKDPVYHLVMSALSSALADRLQRFFRRQRFYYIGPQLDGEYWLPGHRFAPGFPDDPEPSLLNAERVVVIDMNIEAVDKMHAYSLAQERARRYAARLSVLLNAGLYQALPVQRWVLQYSDGASESHRYQLGFSGTNIDEMPGKAELCALGQYSGSLRDTHRVAGELLSLPPESRRILRGIESARPRLAATFDHCARLYQVAAVVGSRFPSVGLAYRVAAVEAIAKGTKEYRSFSDAVRANVEDRPGLEEMLAFLYGSVRSAHFHSGEFPMGEFDLIPFFDPLMDPDVFERQGIQRQGYLVTREAIISWLSDTLPELHADDESEDSSGE